MHDDIVDERFGYVFKRLEDTLRRKQSRHHRAQSADEVDVDVTAVYYVVYNIVEKLGARVFACVGDLVRSVHVLAESETLYVFVVHEPRLEYGREIHTGNGFQTRIEVLGVIRADAAANDLRITYGAAVSRHGRRLDICKRVPVKRNTVCYIVGMHVSGINVSYSEIRHEVGEFLVVIHCEIFKKRFLSGEVRESVMVLSRDKKLVFERAFFFKLKQVIRDGVEQHRAEVMLLLGVGQLLVHNDEYFAVGRERHVAQIAVLVILDLAGCEFFVGAVHFEKSAHVELRRGSAVHERDALLRRIAGYRAAFVRIKVGVSVLYRVVVGAYLVVGHIGISERRIYLGDIRARRVFYEMLGTVAVAERFVVIHIVVAHRDEYLETGIDEAHLVLQLTKQVGELNMPLYFAVQSHVAAYEKIIGRLLSYRVKSGDVVGGALEHHLHARSHVRVIIGTAVAGIGVTIVEGIIVHIGDMRDDHFVRSREFFFGKRAVGVRGHARRSRKRDDRQGDHDQKRNKNKTSASGALHILSSGGQNPPKICSKYYIIYIKDKSIPAFLNFTVYFGYGNPHCRFLRVRVLLFENTVTPYRGLLS